MDEQLEYSAERHARGDVDGDGIIHVNDVTVLLDYLLLNKDDEIDTTAADCNFDGECDIQDVMLLIDYLLYESWHY